MQTEIFQLNTLSLPIASARDEQRKSLVKYIHVQDRLLPAPVRTCEFVCRHSPLDSVGTIELSVRISRKKIVNGKFESHREIYIPRFRLVTVSRKRGKNVGRVGA